MAQTEVILREKVDNLGAEADVVKVKAGFARNFLIPAGKAYEATQGNLRQIENLQAARAKRETEELNEAQELASKISRIKAKFTLDVGKNGKAFGSVTTIDIQKALEDKGVSIDRTSKYESWIVKESQFLFSTDNMFIFTNIIYGFSPT